MDCIERQKDREDFERAGSSTSETPAAFGLTVARNLGCRFIVSVSRLPLPSHNRVKYLTLNRKRIKRSKEGWRICTVHAPKYLSGRERAGNAVVRISASLENRDSQALHSRPRETAQHETREE